MQELILLYTKLDFKDFPKVDGFTPLAVSTILMDQSDIMPCPFDFLWIYDVDSIPEWKTWSEYVEHDYRYWSYYTRTIYHRHVVCHCVNLKEYANLCLKYDKETYFYHKFFKFVRPYPDFVKYYRNIDTLPTAFKYYKKTSKGVEYKIALTRMFGEVFSAYYACPEGEIAKYLKEKYRLRFI